MAGLGWSWVGGVEGGRQGCSEGSGRIGDGWGEWGKGGMEGYGGVKVGWQGWWGWDGM